MMECPSCLRLFPEVIGAPTQVCPHCQHEMATPGAPAAAPVRALPPPDPVGAIQHAWGVARRDYPRLLLLWGPAVALELLAGWLLGVYEGAANLPEDVLLMTTGQRMQWLGVALPLFVLLIAARLALWTGIAARVLGVGRLGPRAWAPAFAAGLVLTVTYSAGVLLLLVGFFVFLHWFLYVPAMLARNPSSVSAAFEASRRFARERRTQGFTALILLVGSALLLATFLAGALGGMLGLLAGAAVGWLVGPILPLLAASYVAVATDAPTDAEPPRIARVTTSCPKCATLIPYEPSGSPIQVVCPNCGHSGRVL